MGGLSYRESRWAVEAGKRRGLLVNGARKFHVNPTLALWLKKGIRDWGSGIGEQRRAVSGAEMRQWHTHRAIRRVFVVLFILHPSSFILLPQRLAQFQGNKALG
jgi:hypothetical protein